MLGDIGNAGRRRWCAPAWVSVLVVTLHVGAPDQAYAQANQCQTADGRIYSEDRARAVVAALAPEVADNRGDMRLWHGAWFAAYSASTAVQGALFFTVDDGDDRAVWGIGAAKALIGTAAIPILGADTRSFQPTGDACADLRELERVLRANAASHRDARGWTAHAGVVGLNLAAALALGLGYDLWERAAIGAAVGVAVGEVQIFTMPGASGPLLRRHEAASVGLTATPTDGGVTLGLIGRW